MANDLHVVLKKYRDYDNFHGKYFISMMKSP